MKLLNSNRQSDAMTCTEVVVVIVVLFVLATLMVPCVASAIRHRKRMNCVNNLLQIQVAMRDWEGGHYDKYPMSVPVARGGAMELNAGPDAGQNAWINFAVLSNELRSPMVLHCPADYEHPATTNFSELKGTISYFINLSASETYPNMIAFGDDNFAIFSTPVKSGLLQLSEYSKIPSEETDLSWTGARHKFVGNFAFVDGSVEVVPSVGLRLGLQQPGCINRLAIP